MHLTLKAVRLSPSAKVLASREVFLSGFRFAGTRGYLGLLSFGPLHSGYECDLDGNFASPLDNVSGTSWHVAAADLPRLTEAFEAWQVETRKKRKRPTAH